VLETGELACRHRRSFGGGLTFTGHVVRWGQRVKPLGVSDVDLPPNNLTALDLVNKYRGIKSLRVTPAA